MGLIMGYNNPMKPAPVAAVMIGDILTPLVSDNEISLEQNTLITNDGTLDAVEMLHQFGIYTPCDNVNMDDLEFSEFLEPEVTGNAPEPTAEGPLVSADAKRNSPEIVDIVSTFVKSDKQVTVEQHRRVNKHHRGQFVSALVAEIKTKLGQPVKSKANDLVIRHLAYSRCKEVGVRPKHAQDIVSKVCVMVYVPDQLDIDAVTLENSNANAGQYSKLSYAKRGSVYRAWIPFKLHNLFSSGPTPATASG